MDHEISLKKAVRERERKRELPLHTLNQASEGHLEKKKRVEIVDKAMTVSTTSTVVQY